MSDLDGWWVHSVSVEPLTGSGAYGDRYGTPQTVPGFLDDSTRLVRDADGQQVVSSSTFYCDLDGYDAFPPGSRVTLGDRTSTVVGRQRHDAPGLDLPDHVEVQIA